MTFLNPFVLFGLAAAAIPVILHLLNLRKLRTIEFSTLSFLKELQQTKIRKLKFRQILLLILRTLAVLAVVFAFARPALKGSFFGKLGGTAHSTVVIIFDDSFSMSASDEFGERLKQAKEKTERLLDLVTEGDEVYLLRLSDLPSATIDPPTHDISAVRRAIRETAVSSVRRPLTAALDLADNLLNRSNNANKEVYVVSDMQGSLTQGPESQHKETGTATSEIQSRPNVHYFLVETGNKPVDNVGIDSVEILSKIFESGKPVEIAVTVRNYGSAPVANSALSAFLDNARAGQSTLRIDPWSSSRVMLKLQPKHTGIIRGYVELENDAIEQDNRRYFSVTIPSSIHIALVADNAADSRFPLLALRAAAADSGESTLNVRQTTSAQFPLIDLKSTDVLVVMNCAGITPTGAANIAGFVQRGGGLVILPAGNCLPAEFSVLSSALGVPPFTGITGSMATPANLSFRQVDRDHPLFESMFEHASRPGAQAAELESPQIATALRTTAGRNGHVVIGLSSGDPFLTEYRSGLGAIFVYTVAPVLPWSDFPVKGLFVPMIHRTMLYLASPGGGSAEAYAGSDARITVNRPAVTGANGSQFSLTGPDGTSEFLLPENGRGGDSQEQPPVPSGLLGFIKPRAALPGFYELKRGDELLSVLSVNPDPRESDTRPADPGTLGKEWERRGITPEVISSADQASALQTTITQSRFGVELWRYFLLAALLLALTEMWVARDGSKSES